MEPALTSAVSIIELMSTARPRLAQLAQLVRLGGQLAVTISRPVDPTNIFMDVPCPADQP